MYKVILVQCQFWSSKNPKQDQCPFFQTLYKFYYHERGSVRLLSHFGGGVSGVTAKFNKYYSYLKNNVTGPLQIKESPKVTCI